MTKITVYRYDEMNSRVAEGWFNLSKTPKRCLKPIR
jgi:hypothetical protein